MGLMIDQGGPSGEYEAVVLPPAPGTSARSLGSAVFLRRSARPSRRAVLHLHDMTGSFAPADLARWYNERGFHFYVADIEVAESLDARRRLGRPAPGFFAALDAACEHMRKADGIDAIILSAEETAASSAALWCDARRAASPVDALILSSPEFGRSVHARLRIACPVLVISRPPPGTSSEDRGLARDRRRDTISLGQHVTWLYLDSEPQQSGADGPMSEAARTAQRRQLFDEMGRWLGAYMYGKVRDQLLLSRH